MTVRRVATTLGVALLAVPAGARAADPLLSGYGGPGGGEQVVLGSKMLPPKSGKGGLRASAPAAARRPAPAQLTVAPRPAVPARPARKTRRQRAASKPSAPPATTPPAPAPVAPRVVPYPSSVSGAGGLPLNRDDLAMLLLAGLALGLVATATRRLVREAPEAGSA